MSDSHFSSYYIVFNAIPFSVMSGQLSSILIASSCFPAVLEASVLCAFSSLLIQAFHKLVPLSFSI